MEQRIHLCYEEPLRKIIIAMLENGELTSIQHARRKFFIGGNSTIQRWLKKYDKEHLRPMRASKTLELELERAEEFDPELYNSIMRTIDQEKEIVANSAKTD